MSDRITRVYTRGGDKGETSLVGGQRVRKDDLRIDCYGAVDELNAVVGMARAELHDAGRPRDLDAILERVQNELFDLGSLLATLPQDQSDAMPRLGAAHVERLEREMDAVDLPALRNFVLPGGSKLNASLHLARTVCRRAERLCVALHARGDCGADEVRYLNRLSDAFFVWSRWAAKDLGHDEVLWRPGRA